MNVTWPLATLLLTIVSMQTTLGEPAPSANAASARPQDEQAIKDASQQLAKSFAAGDAGAVAALFTEEAEYQDDEGAAVHGRKALAAAYAKLFAEAKGLTAESKPESVRFLGPASLSGHGHGNGLCRKLQGVPATRDAAVLQSSELLEEALRDIRARQKLEGAFPMLAPPAQ